MKITSHHDLSVIQVILIIVVVLLLGLAGFGAYTQRNKVVVVSSNSHAALFTVTDSGSTNTIGWSITVNADGSGSRKYSVGPADVRKPDYGTRDLSSKTYPEGTFQTTTVQKLLRSYGDISKLSASSCMKPASFGTVQRVVASGKTSQDVSCPASPTASSQRLIDTIKSVIKPATP